jgi:hypothetical protein
MFINNNHLNLGNLQIPNEFEILLIWFFFKF